MDKALLLWVNQDWIHPWLDIFFSWISSYTGFSIPMLIGILALLWWQYKKDGVKLWLMLITVVILGDQLGNLLKHIIDLPRPCYSLYELVRQPGRLAPGPCGGATTGMPSNHALNFCVVATFLGIILRPRAWAISLYLMATLVAISRVYLGKHFPSQVLVGAGIGMLAGYLSAWLTLKYHSSAQRIHHRQVASD